MNLLRHAPGTPAGRILGIRPEHLQLTPGEGWSLQADTVELLGAERLVHARLGQETLTVRLDEAVAAPVPGQHFSASPRPDCVYHFDLGTGLRLPS
jgi:sn-glycerol 3-phosphate transport system ATP-binding protein